jgi:hypothetical protein
VNLIRINAIINRTLGNRISAILFTIIIFKSFLLLVIAQRMTDWEKYLRQLHSVHLVQRYLGKNPPDAESHHHPSTFQADDVGFTGRLCLYLAAHTHLASRQDIT